MCHTVLCLCEATPPPIPTGGGAAAGPQLSRPVCGAEPRPGGTQGTRRGASTGVSTECSGECLVCGRCVCVCVCVCKCV